VLGSNHDYVLVLLSPTRKPIAGVAVVDALAAEGNRANARSTVRPTNTMPNGHQPEAAVHFHVNNPITSLLIGKQGSRQQPKLIPFR